MEAVGIVAGRHEQRTGDVGTDAFDGDQLWRGGADELLQLCIQGVDLGTELGRVPFQLGAVKEQVPDSGCRRSSWERRLVVVGG